MTKKLRIGVIFGGRSGEHEVSLRSAESIINAMDRSKYEVIPIGITREGRWLSSHAASALLPQALMDSTSNADVAIIGDPTKAGLRRLSAGAAEDITQGLDVVFPVLHGTYGEDGTIQGLLEMAGIPYVGCGVLASSVGMDKILMKQVFERAGLTVTPYEYFLRSAWEADPIGVERRIAGSLGFPVFCKPANLGSSVGISRAAAARELHEAIADAARYDRRIIVEKAVDGREIELSVLGNDNPIVSLPGEILPAHEFYDYEAKYVDPSSRTVVPADLPDTVVAKLQEEAATAFRAIDGAGLCRADFFVAHGTDQTIVNEVNTMPGFTSISMYAKMWEASGIGYSELIDRLIDLALERHADKSRNLTTYQPRAQGQP